MKVIIAVIATEGRKAEAKESVPQINNPAKMNIAANPKKVITIFEIRTTV